MRRNLRAPPRQIDEERQGADVRLLTGVHLRIRIGEANRRRVAAGLGKDPPAEARCERRITPGRYVQDFKPRPGTDALRVGPAAERPGLLGGSFALHGQHVADDLFGIFTLGVEVSLSVARGHAKQLCQQEHPRYPRAAMNLMAVTLGRKQ
jgi:hypothetical protein